MFSIGLKERQSKIDWTLLLALVLLLGCRNDRTGDAPPPTGAPPPLQSGAPEWFVDRAQETGLDFVHFNGMSGEFYDSEIFAPGVGLFDYDNDGDLDVYIAQGRMLGSKTIAAAMVPPKGPLPLKGRLYRNDLEIHTDGTRTLHFTDVTEASGLNVRGYGMGVPLEYALALVRLKRYQEARDRLLEAMKTYPDHPEFVDALAHLKDLSDR